MRNIEFYKCEKFEYTTTDTDIKGYESIDIHGIRNNAVHVYPIKYLD
jgi:hypothetical protein